MLITRQILARALVLGACMACLAASLSACGQPGALYLPSESAAPRRASLPQSIIPGTSSGSAAPSVPASAPKTP